jgi:phosphatidylserine/phosphatidylglycerophosphate/cardiolipin synthase-like enzyme
MITGPLLYDLNHNFSQAWDKAAQGQPGHVESDLLQKRSHIKADHIPLASQAAIIQNGTAGRVYPVPAQICRTQPQHNVRNIETLYLQAVMQIGRVVYFENQYFRFAPLITTMKKNRIAYHEWGGDRPLYVFVVTNSTAPVEESQEKATANTFRMLAALGRDDTMPEIARTQEKEALEAQLKDDQRHHPEHIDADRARLKELETRVIQRKDFGPIKAVVCTLVCPDHGKHIPIPETKAEQLAGIKARLQNVRKQTARLDSYFLAQRRRTLSPDEKAQFAELNRQCAELHDQYDAVSELPNPPPELKRQPDGVPYKPIWTPVYVHSKTTILDDAVIIHGSANLNVRSMEVDSELNIVVPDYDAALSMRRDLWRIHAGEDGAVDDEAKAFNFWEALIQQNRDQESQYVAPVASIIGFYDTQNTWGTWD